MSHRVIEPSGELKSLASQPFAAKAEGEWCLTRWDVAGAFGDIGVLFPIAIALISLNRLNPTAVFLTAGLAYVLAGAYFQIPMAVQPFKAVAAIALALALPPSAIASAGLLMGLLMTAIAVTNLVTPLARLFTLPIIRGIQLGLGLLLAKEGLRLILGTSAHVGPPERTAAIPAWAVALAGALVLLAFLRSRRFPAALVLLGAGLLFGLVTAGRQMGSLGWGPVPLEFLHLKASELSKVLWVLVVPQFALTFGNSIVATENTAQVLFGPQARRVTTRALSLSIGLTNLVSGLLLSAPSCHGSGGITAHYRFGARRERSTYVIGGVCLLLALLGRAAVGVIHLIPVAILGVFLIYVGVQHAALVRDIVPEPSRGDRAWPASIAVTVGIISLATTNLTWGFLSGFALEALSRALVGARRRPAAQSS